MYNLLFYKLCFIISKICSNKKDVSHNKCLCVSFDVVRTVKKCRNDGENVEDNALCLSAKTYKGPGVHRAILEFDGFSRQEERRKRRRWRRRRSVSVRCVLVLCLRAFVRCDGVQPHVDARRQHRNSGAAGINLCGATLSERAPGPHPGVGGRYPRIEASGEIP